MRTETEGLPRLRQIRASAGSGKTYTLTTGFLELLAESSESENLAGCRADGAGGRAHCWPEILAVTFTNRAAAEMQERVIGRLKETALGLNKNEAGDRGRWTPAEASRWLDVILRRYGSLNIRTIDSLLHLVVRLGALQLDLPPDFTPVFATSEALSPLLDSLLEKARHDETVAELLREACRKVVFHDGTYRGFLAGHLLRSRVMELVMPLLDAGPGRLAPPEDLSARLAELTAEVRDRAGLLAACLEADGLKGSSLFLKALDKCRAIRSGDPAPSSVLLRKPCLDDCLLKVSKGCAGAGAEALFQGLRAAVEAMENQGNLLRQALQIMPFVPLAKTLVRELPGFLREAGAIPAVLVPQLARRVLAGEHGVSETFCRLGTTLTHLLIDEFQDTSRDQWQAVQPLILEALSRGGSLTWVGDVKQAIYGWRGGDATLFDEVLADPELAAVAPDPQRDTLPTNWRSCSAIVGFNNAVFSRLSRQETAGAVLAALLPKDVPSRLLEQASTLLRRGFAESAQLECGKKGGCVRLKRLPESEEDPDEAVREELFTLMSELSLRRSWGEITVLVRSNRRSAQVAGWLMSGGVPVVTDNSFLLAEHPLVIQLTALLAFMDSPRDDPAFWTLLSGPLLPLSEEERSELKDRLVEWRDHRPLYADFRENFPELWEIWLEPFYSGAGLLTAYDTVREALDRLDADTRFPDEAVFLRRFLEVLHLAEGQGYGSVSAFLEYWKEHGREEKAPMPESLDAVRVMTVHKAKGLQFPVVVVPWHEMTVRADAAPVAVDVNGLRLLAKPGPAMGEGYYKALADVAREAVHLLYVAWTRPEEELYGFFTPSRATSRDALDILLNELPFQDGVYQRGTPQMRSETEHGAPSGTTGGAPSDPASPDGSSAPSPPRAGTTEAPRNAWRPMQWLPRLRIFRNPLESLALTPKRRGVLMHRCLACLRLTGDPRSDASAAVDRVLRAFPLALENPQAVSREMFEAVSWYAALPQAGAWLRFGTPEREVVDAEGEVFRPDLVVDDGSQVTVVEYKTGEPQNSHAIQLRHYMQLLASAQPLPVDGVLVYLDQRTVRKLTLT